MAKQILKFPEGFLWGASTSAHQIEGNNFYNDWWAWEHSVKREDALRRQGKNPADYYSGLACDSFNRFEEDFQLAQYLGHNAHRLSIEWSRIQPREGEFDESAFEHYEKVFQSAKAHGLTLFVTLHHFTSPLWFMKKGGFAKSANLKYFFNYAQVAVKRLNEYVDFWLTFNEPEVYVAQCYYSGAWPPQEKNFFTMFRTAKNLIAAHNLLAREIRILTRKPVSIAYKLMDLKPIGEVATWLDKYIYEKINRYVFNQTRNQSDFIGVNYYFHHHLGMFGERRHSRSRHLTSDLGWGIHPEGLERVLLSLKNLGKPVYVTENGLADARDLKREKFIKDHLYYLHRAIERGVDVRGYLHWSLIDNFEWDKGFAPRFGLIAVDHDSILERKIRSSALAYAKICKSNEMEY